MIAGLPMYDFDWTTSALNAFWANLSMRLRRMGIDAPAKLARSVPPEEIWRDPMLVFGQTCGYPYWRSLRDRVALIATPAYAFEGCEGARHCSLLVARRGDGRSELKDFCGARAAVNGGDSNTGMNLFRALVAPLAQGRRFFAEVVITGAHARSLIAVAEGNADIAAVDCVSLALIRRGRPDLVERVQTIARSPTTPGLPFIASAALSPRTLACIRSALFQTLADPALSEALATLGVTGAEVLDAETYAYTSEIEQAAIELGYPELA